MRLGVLTGGGDCPGLNAAIRAIPQSRNIDLARGRSSASMDSWDGVMEQRYTELTNLIDTRSPSQKGNHFGTRRGSPARIQTTGWTCQGGDVDLRIDALIVIWGNGSLTVASILHQQHGLPVIGVPKTIDNDVVGTDTTFGFQTAVQIATDAIDRLHTTAESHDRIMVVEVMGRDAGWIAMHAGIAGGATAIVIPEIPFDIDEVAAIVSQRHARGRYASVVVVAEGALPIAGTLVMPAQRDRYGHELLETSRTLSVRNYLRVRGTNRE